MCGFYLVTAYGDDVALPRAPRSRGCFCDSARPQAPDVARAVYVYSETWAKFPDAVNARVVTLEDLKQKWHMSKGAYAALIKLQCDGCKER